MIFRRFIAALALLCAVSPAYAQKTKAQLDSEITTSYPDNVMQLITPAIVRGVSLDVVNSIMPTAPVVSGNLACFDGTTGLLQDCGSAPPTVPLTVGTTPINSGVTARVLYDNAGVLGEYTNAQLTALINLATTSLSGALPAWPNNTSTFFRGDGTYVTLNCAALAGVASSCSTDATNATNITSGTLANGRYAAVNLAAGNINGGVTGIAPVANGGTNCASASGTCVDNVSGFNSTGYLRRTGAGAYSFSAAATAAQYLAGTATAVPIEPSVIYTAEITTTFGATTTFDFSTFINTAVTLTGNITTMTLSNVKAGQAGQIRFIQDGTGGRTSVFNSIFKFSGGVAPVLTTTAAAVDALEYNCVASSYCVASLILNVK